VPGLSLGVERGGAGLFSTHAAISTADVGLKRWSTVTPEASMFTAVPKTALGFELYGVASLGLSPTHAAISTPDLGLKRWSTITPEVSTFAPKPARIERAAYDNCLDRRDYRRAGPSEADRCVSRTARITRADGAISLVSSQSPRRRRAR
jgi:hypothetical protein